MSPNSIQSWCNKLATDLTRVGFRYNYKHIPIREEDLNFSLTKVAHTLKEEGDFDYEKLVNEGLINKKILRDMFTTCIMVDGSKYTGQFQKGRSVKDGIGHIIYPDGSLFEGIFRSDDTVKGRYIFTNGYVYEGEMKNHKMHGKGVLKYQGKIIYSGDFEDGEQCADKISLISTASNNSPTPNDLQTLRSNKSVQFVF